MDIPKRGEIWQVQLKVKDSVGHEQMNDRPCVVIVPNAEVSLSTVIPLTGDLYAARLPHTYKIGGNIHNGLPMDSIALIYQLRSLDHERFLKRLGILGKKDLKALLDLIADYFGLPTR
jgi:mRNA-degrading endonuclease toxin of MazEF toxin-antitoxin module